MMIIVGNYCFLLSNLPSNVNISTPLGSFETTSSPILFTCLEKGQFYDDLGPHYTLRSPHIGGAPDVANSLHAIQQLVYVEKKLTLPQLVEILRRNWEGEEVLRHI